MSKVKVILFWLISCTWGAIMTSIGAVVALVLICTGHAIQNIILGVFMPFVVCIPSAVRYWWREWVKHRGRSATLPPYDSIWFEGWASRLGEKYFN